MEINTSDFIIRARKVIQGEQQFLITVLPIQSIFRFTRFTERVIIGFNEDNYPEYNEPEIQRKLEPGRVEKIADFLLDDPDAIFPTNIVLSIPNAAIKNSEEVDDNVNIELNDKVFTELNKKEGDVYITIMDGQHRIRGIEKALERIKNDISSARQVLLKSSSKDIQKRLEKDTKKLTHLLNINLLVTFFVDPTREYQALIFSTINRTQKSVPQSLVSSLFGLSDNDSPQKTSLEVVLALNAFDKSPFFNRIKLYGGTYGRNQSPPLTQAGMVASIIDLICVNLRDSERDRFKPRKDLITHASPNLPFRRYYARNEDNFITDILFSFFSAVRNTYTVRDKILWDLDGDNKPKNILQTTAGYKALLQILVDILKREKEDSARDQIETYTPYLEKAKQLNFEDEGRYPFTNKSRKVLYLDMSLAIWPTIEGDDDRKTALIEALHS